MHAAQGAEATTCIFDLTVGWGHGHGHLQREARAWPGGRRFTAARRSVQPATLD